MKGVRNEALGEAFREYRKGSRTQPHEDSRTQRARSRADAERRAISDQER